MVRTPRLATPVRPFLLLLGASVLAMSPAPARALADDGAIVIHGVCPDGQHEALGGGCVCNDSRQIVVDQVCVPDPGQLFAGPGALFDDVCSLLGICGGGGGGGGGNPTPPGDGEDDACLVADGSSCDEAFDACVETHEADSALCESDPARARCLAGEWAFGTPDCRLRVDLRPGGSLGLDPSIGADDLVECSFEPDAPAVWLGTLEELQGFCIQSWNASGRLGEARRACRDEADDFFEECLDGVESQCQDCSSEEPTALFALPPEPAEPTAPEALGWLRAKVRTKGHTVLGAEGFARDGTRATCFWRVVGGADGPTGGELYCPMRGDRWASVGDMLLVAFERGAYAATGHCGVATADGSATGDAAYLLKTSLAPGGSLRKAHLRSISGAVSGSLDGRHSYRGDCRMRGKLVGEDDVPASLRAHLEGR